MSLWGFWTVIVGAVSLAIGFGGLVALFLSLRQTRQAITNDRRIGEAQTRAYIAVEPQTDLPPVDISPEGIPELGIVVRNVGNSPARNVRHIAFAGKLPAHLPVPCNDLVRPIDGAVLRATDILTGDRTVLSVDSELSWNDIVLLADPGGETRYGIAGIIWYDDVFDSHYVRRFCYHVDLKFDRKTTNVKGMALVQMGFSVANSHNDEVKRD